MASEASIEDDELVLKVIEALEEAQLISPGPERTAALEKAAMLRNAADTYDTVFSGELPRPK